MQDAIALCERFDAGFLDALTFAWNERQTPDDIRVAEYLKRCAEERYKKDPSLRLIDLGIDPTQTPTQTEIE